MDYAQKALEMHRKWKGKIRVSTPCALENRDDLSVAYTPGVAAPCLEIQKDVDKSYEYTRRGNLVAVVTDGTAVLGKGAAIKVMDGSVLCHPSMVSKLRALAEEKGIQAQTDIIRSGGTDAGAIHQIRGGVVTGGVSVPCRYIHSPQEMVDTVDVEACAALIAAFVQSKLD